MRRLLDAGADTTIRNRYGGTALTPAGHRGHAERRRQAELAALLRRAGAR